MVSTYCDTNPDQVCTCIFTSIVLLHLSDCPSSIFCDLQQRYEHECIRNSNVNDCIKKPSMHVCNKKQNNNETVVMLWVNEKGIGKVLHATNGQENLVDNDVEGGCPSDTSMNSLMMIQSCTM